MKGGDKLNKSKYSLRETPPGYRSILSDIGGFLGVVSGKKEKKQQRSGNNPRNARTRAYSEPTGESIKLPEARKHSLPYAFGSKKFIEQASEQVQLNKDAMEAGVYRPFLDKYIKIAKDTDTLFIFSHTNCEAMKKLAQDPGRYTSKTIEIKATSASEETLAPYMGNCSPEERALIIEKTAGLIPQDQWAFAKGNAERRGGGVKNMAKLLNTPEKYRCVEVSNGKKDGERKVLSYVEEGGKITKLAFRLPFECDRDPQIKRYKVLQKNVEGFKGVLSDNDLILMARSFVSLGPEVQNARRGSFHFKEGKVLEALSDASHNFVAHAADNHNPEGFALPPMSKDKPHIAIYPDGSHVLLHSMEEFLSECNRWRTPDSPMEKAYNVVLNWREGFAVNRNGELYHRQGRTSPEEIQKQIDAIPNDGQKALAQRVFNTQGALHEMKMERSVVIHHEKAGNSKSPSLTEFGKAFDKKSGELAWLVQEYMRAYDCVPPSVAEKKPYGAREISDNEMAQWAFQNGAFGFAAKEQQRQSAKDRAL